MFIVDILWDWDEIPNGRISYQETFSDALKAAERMQNQFPESHAKSIEIFESTDKHSKDKRLIASLRIFR